MEELEDTLKTIVNGKVFKAVDYHGHVWVVFEVLDYSFKDSVQFLGPK